MSPSVCSAFSETLERQGRPQTETDEEGWEAAKYGGGLTGSHSQERSEVEVEEAEPERAVGAVGKAVRSVKESQHLCTCHQAPGWAWRVCSGERDKQGTVSGGEQVTLHTRNGDSDNLD